MRGTWTGDFNGYGFLQPMTPGSEPAYGAVTVSVVIDVQTGRSFAGYSGGTKFTGVVLEDGTVSLQGAGGHNDLLRMVLTGHLMARGGQYTLTGYGHVQETLVTDASVLDSMSTNNFRLVKGR